MRNIYINSKNIKGESYKKEYSIYKDEIFNYILFLSSEGIYNIDLKFFMKEEGSICYVYIIEKGVSHQNINISLEVIHKVKNTQAKVFVRKVMYSDSISFIRGLIRINKGAQNSNDYFDEKTLLLSDKVVSKVIPSLEIIPDNVKASHASSVSGPNLDELFYLESRGIDKINALNLISEGFLLSKLDIIENQELIDKVKVDIQKGFI
jgi:Fe-S cluster assembly protein SufD